MMSRKQLHHLSGAYVLNALDEDERVAFEARLAEWDDMRGEVTELADTAAALGLALPPVDPDPRLRDALLGRVAVTPQASPRPSTPTVPAVPRILESLARLRRLRAPLVWTLSAAAAILCLLIVRPALLPDRPALPDTAAQLAKAPDARRIAVELPGAEGVELIWSDDLDASALTWRALPPLEDGKVYELWYIDDSPRPAGLVPDESAGARLLEGTMRSGDRIAVTVEPRGGSPQPTTQPLVVIEPA